MPTDNTGAAYGWCAKADQGNLVCREGFQAPMGEGCVNTVNDLQGDVPHVNNVIGHSVGLRIRQVRTKKTISHVYGEEGPGMEITPPFELDNEDEATWSRGGRLGGAVASRVPHGHRVPGPSDGGGDALAQLHNQRPQSRVCAVRLSSCGLARRRRPVRQLRHHSNLLCAVTVTVTVAVAVLWLCCCCDCAVKSP